MREGDRKETDPIQMLVMTNRIDGITRDMTNTLVRTARSTTLDAAAFLAPAFAGIGERKRPIVARQLAAGGGLIILCAAWVVGPRGVDWAIAVWVAMLAGLTLPGLWPSLRAASWAAVAVWVDLGLSAIRYVAAFYLLGTSLDAVTSEALAGTSNLASSVPFVGGGPGLREWAVGWMTSRLELLPDALVLGVMADILVRIGTLIVLAPLGGWSLKSLSGTLKRAVMDQSSSGSMPKSRTVNNASNS